MKSRLEQLLDELLRQIDIPAMEQAMSKQYKSHPQTLGTSGRLLDAVGALLWTANRVEQ